MSRRAIFLDRDGTINEDFGYLANPSLVQILPGVISALSILRKHHWLLILVSNQSGIGRGYFSLKELRAVQERIEMELDLGGIKLDGFYFCPHSPSDRCKCRKPEPGLLLNAAEEQDINLSQSWMIGDKISDILAGQRAGCRSILINKNQNQLFKNEPFQFAIVKPDLLAATQFILTNSLYL